MWRYMKMHMAGGEFIEAMIRQNDVSFSSKGRAY
jgi:hypothetical protein